MIRVQLNARIDSKLKQRVAMDKAENPRFTQDIIVEAALNNFFSQFSKERRVEFYRSHNRKPYQAAKK